MPREQSPSPELSETGGFSSGEILPPLVLAQFLASYANSSANVAIGDITQDLGAAVTQFQMAITFFTLIMAALMITGSKLTDIWGRKLTFRLGIAVYALGSLVATLATSMGLMYLGFSLLQGIGSALMIPPIYILITVSFGDLRSRAQAFGLVGAMAGLGASSGPLVGGLLATVISWRAIFASQVLLALVILYLSRRVRRVGMAGPKPALDILGAVLSAAGMALIVFGFLLAADYGWFRARQEFTVGGAVVVEQGGISPVWLFVGAGFVVLLAFFWHIRARERRGAEPLVSTRVLANRTANLGMVTQGVQWFMLIGVSFIVPVFLQVAREQSPIDTGLMLTPSTVGILLASWAAGRLASTYSQRALLLWGFVVAIAGVVLMLLLGGEGAGGWSLAPGLLVFGLGAGVITTSSVNVVQSSMPEEDQGELSGLSRSVSNLGSSLGTAVAGAILISTLITGVITLTQQSEVLPPEAKDRIAVALEEDVSTLSDTQVREALQGQPRAVVDEVVRINAEARDRALGLALLSLGLIGFLGLWASVLLPSNPTPSAPTE